MFNSQTPQSKSPSLETKYMLESQDTASQNLNSTDKSVSSLIEAIQQNNQAEFCRLLNQKTDSFGKRFIDEVDEDGAGPLHWAAFYGHVHFIAPLIQVGTDINRPQDKRMVTPLYIAAEEGHAAAITVLKAMGADVDMPNHNGSTPVFAAACYGHSEAIAALKAVSAAIDTPNHNGSTPVYIAAANGYPKAITALKAAGANVDTYCAGGITPIFVAVQERHTEVVKALLAADADVSASTPYGTPLEQAKKSKDPGCAEIVKLLEAHLQQYSNGIKPMSVTFHTRRPSVKLNLTDKKEKQEISYILEHLRTFFLEERDIGERTENYALYNEYLKKADTNVRLVHKQTQNKHILYINDEPVDNETAAKEILKILRSLAVTKTPQKPMVLETSQPLLNNPTSQVVSLPAAFVPKLNLSDQKNLPEPSMLPQFSNLTTKPTCEVNASTLKVAEGLIEAIKKNNQAEVFRLLTLNTDCSGKKVIHEVDAKYNGSALHLAAALGYVHFIIPLVKAGINVNKQDKDGRTPVYEAAAEGHVEAIAALKAAGANMDQPNNNGKTPAFIAAQNGHAEAITALKAAGANMNTPNKNGATPVYVAAQNGHAEAITALKAAGANMDTPNKNGVTPVYTAAHNGHVKAIAALKAAGANVDTPIPDGITPVWISACNGYPKAVAVLKAAGANMDTPNKDGDTPLCKAAENGDVATITALLEAGANASIKTKRGTALMKGKGQGHSEVVKLLEAHFEQYPNGIKPTTKQGVSLPAKSSSSLEQKNATVKSNQVFKKRLFTS